MWRNRFVIPMKFRGAILDFLRILHFSKVKNEIPSMKLCLVDKYSLRYREVGTKLQWLSKATKSR